MSNEIIAVIIGALLGFLGTYLTHLIQNKSERKKEVARTLLLENKEKEYLNVTIQILQETELKYNFNKFFSKIETSESFKELKNVANGKKSNYTMNTSAYRHEEYDRVKDFLISSIQHLYIPENNGRQEIIHFYNFLYAFSNESKSLGDLSEGEASTYVNSIELIKNLV